MVVAVALLALSLRLPKVHQTGDALLGLSHIVGSDDVVGVQLLILHVLHPLGANGHAEVVLALLGRLSLGFWDALVVVGHDDSVHRDAACGLDHAEVSSVHLSELGSDADGLGDGLGVGDEVLAGQIRANSRQLYVVHGRVSRYVELHFLHTVLANLHVLDVACLDGEHDLLQDVLRNVASIDDHLAALDAHHVAGVLVDEVLHPLLYHVVWKILAEHFLGVAGSEGHDVFGSLPLFFLCFFHFCSFLF